MRSYHLKFYIPILLLWGSVLLSTLNPALVQSDIQFDPLIQRDDLMRVDIGADVALDDVVIYRINWVDYVAQVIGLPGQEIILGLDGRSIIRDGERVVLARGGFEISTNASGIVMVEDGQVAVYAQNFRRNPFIGLVSKEEIRGPVDKVYRYADLGRSEWLAISAYSVIVLALIFLPFATFTRQPSQTFFRIVVLVTHSFMTLAVAGALLAASLPGDPMQIGTVEPIWWWFPLAVVFGFDRELLLVVVLFLAIQGLWLRKPWRRA